MVGLEYRDFERSDELNVLVDKAFEASKEIIDYKLGVIASLGIMAPVVTGINYLVGSSLQGSLLAGGKQALYTFFIGGAIMRLGTRFSHIKNKTKSYLTSTLIPALLTIAMSYGVHKYIKESPEPLYSTIPTILVIPALAINTNYQRKKYTEKIKF